MMIALIKALLKQYMQLYYIIDGENFFFFIKIFTLILTRCYIILCITTMELNLKNWTLSLCH